MHITAATLTLNVTNLGKAIAFYQSIGFNLEQQWGEYYAQMNASGFTLGLHPTDPVRISGNSGNASIGLTVPEFDKAKNVLTDLNVPFKERIEEGGRFLHFQDPDGTALYIIEPKW